MIHVAEIPLEEPFEDDTVEDEGIVEEQDEEESDSEEQVSNGLVGVSFHLISKNRGFGFQFIGGADANYNPEVEMILPGMSPVQCGHSHNYSSHTVSLLDSCLCCVYCVLSVLSVIHNTGSAAEDAGIRPGDKIISVNSQDIRGLTHFELVSLIKQVQLCLQVLPLCINIHWYLVNLYCTPL